MERKIKIFATEIIVATLLAIMLLGSFFVKSIYLNRIIDEQKAKIIELEKNLKTAKSRVYELENYINYISRGGEEK